MEIYAEALPDRCGERCPIEIKDITPYTCGLIKWPKSSEINLRLSALKSCIS
jgi:hypothetical protein